MATPLKHDAQAINQAIERIASAIATRHATTDRLLLLGIANGGIVLAARLAERLKKAGLRPGTGTIDISFHRDDIGRNPIPKEFSPTIIPHDVNGATVILVDDVLYSGRTVKASLDELNTRLGGTPLPMDRFRPNLVVAGCPPFAEDTWPRFRIGDVTFRSGGPCARCIMITTDQATAERGKEPLRTLATYRRDAIDPTDVNFGQNLIHETKSGRIHVGDAVQVL